MKFHSETPMENPVDKSMAVMRPKRELSLKERGEQCKKMELSQKSFSMINDVIGDLGDIPVVGDFFGFFLTGASVVTHLASGGLDIASTALDCADLPFDEIKEIMDKRFNEVERRLDRNAAALQAVSKLVAKTLDAVERSREEMNKRFDEVLASIENAEIQPIVSRINHIVQYFDTERDRITGLKQEDYVAKLEEPNSILLYLRESRTSKMDSLHAPLIEIIDLKYAIPDNMEHEIAFKALYALIYGTQTYISIMFFLLEQYTFLSNYHYERGDIDKYNKYFDDINTVFLDFKSSLIGGASSASQPLLDKTIDVLREVTGKEFLRLQKDDTVQMLKEKIDTFTDLKESIADMVLPIILETPENFVQISFKKNIKTNIGEWENGKGVRYAVQYESENAYSNVGDWSKATTVRAKACPSLRIPVDQRRKTRLIFRKFENELPQLAGAVKPYETQFTDIDRDVYNAAEMSDKDTGFAEAKIFLSNGGNITTAFEKGRRAFHAAAYSGNFRLGTYFLLIDKSADINVRDKNGYTPLHVAADVGQSGFIKFLLKHDALVNAKTDPELSTPLHLAVKHGFVKTVTTLLSSPKINVNERNRSGFTALHNAVLGGRYVLAALISKDGTDINAKSKMGLTPFHLAAINNDREVAEVLMGSNKVEVNAGDKNSMTPLHYAAMMGHNEMVHYIMTLGGINLNAVTNDNRWTPLHYAIMFKKDNVASELLKSRDINIALKADGELTPLHFAVTFGRKSVVQELIAKRVNIEEKTAEGYTALHLASMRRTPEIINVLLDSGANIEAQTLNSSTPLHVASMNGRVDCAVTLLDNRANLKAIDNDGQTPIHVAAFNDQLEMTRKLLERDASLKELPNRDGETPLLVAAQKSNTAIVKDLLDKGANINAQDNTGATALIMFGKKGNVNMVEYFFSKNANLYIADKQRLNFFYYAIQNNHLDVVKYALSNKAFDWNRRDDNGDGIIKHFALCNAASSGRLEILKYFIDTLKVNMCKPLHVGARNGHLHIVKYMVEDKKEKPDGKRSITGAQINTPLCEAAINGHLEIVKYLKEKKADVNKKCMLLQTALHLSIYFNKLEVVKYLADNGARIDISDVAGNSPLHFTAMQNRLEMAKYLVENHNANINDFNNQHNTPLHVAAEHGYLDIVKYLVDKNADKGLLNREGKTALDLAKEWNRNDVVSYLESSGRFLRDVSRMGFSTHKRFLPLSNVAPNPMAVKRVIGYEKSFANENDEASSSKMSDINAPLGADIINTLLLLNVIVRYLTNEKYVNTTADSISETDAQAYALNIVEKFEDIYKLFTDEIDLSEVHANLYKALKSGKSSKVHDILCSSVDTFKSLSSEEKQKLVTAFDSIPSSIKNTVSPSSTAEEFNSLPHAIFKSCFNSEGNSNILRI